MVEVPSTTAPATVKSKSCSMVRQQLHSKNSKHPLFALQLLDEICQKNNWGSPIYSLHSSTSTGVSGEPDTLFLYKATVVGIGMTYIPSKLCRNLSEAREIAAEHALIQLGYPLEGISLVWTCGQY